MNTPATFTDAVPGWFGKLACLGDFASRRLPPEFVTACDGWLSQCVDKSRAQLGDIWLDTYLTSPLWRFAWAPDVIDDRWWFGVMMPSVDNVGRYFPLVVALPRTAAPYDGEDLNELERWFGEISDAMCSTLTDGSSLDRFESQLQGTPRFLERPGSGRPPEETHWTNRTGFQFTSARSLGDSFHDLMQQDVVQRYRGRTSGGWCARVEESQLTVATGLPMPESFVDLLQGAW